MKDFKRYLQGGDLRSIADVDKVLDLIKTQNDFETLFQLLYSNERLMVMRTADAIEKITLTNPEFLSNHNRDIIDLLENANDKELKWHLALLASRINPTMKELEAIWKQLKNWATNRKESKIVRVNSIQSLFDLSKRNDKLKGEFELIVRKVETENVPSIKARLRKLEAK